MASIESIAVTTEIERKNVLPVLNEIKHALNDLLNNASSRIIDIRSLPFGVEEEKQLVDYLGKGEISIELDALGKSEIMETRFKGVWLITHKTPDGAVASRYIEIAHVPEIVKTPKADIEDSISLLSESIPY